MIEFLLAIIVPAVGVCAAALLAFTSALLIRWLRTTIAVPAHVVVTHRLETTPPPSESWSTGHQPMVGHHARRELTAPPPPLPAGTTHP